MKTKKLIAILTIVALMMTLVPMTAFAAEYSVTATNVVPILTTAKADNTAEAIVDVIFANSAGYVMTGQLIDTFYVKSSSDAVSIDAYHGADGTTQASLTKAGNKFTATGLTANTAEGIIRLKVKASLAGEVLLTLWRDSNCLTDKIGEATLTFTADPTAANTIGLVVTNAAGTTTHVDGASVDIGTAYVLKARVTDLKGAGVANTTVTFKEASTNGGIFSAIGTATTDALGYAKMTVTKTVNGDSFYDAVVGTKKYSDADADGYKIVNAPLAPMKIALTSLTDNFEFGPLKTATLFVTLNDYYGNSTNKVTPTVTALNPNNVTVAGITTTWIAASKTFMVTVPVAIAGSYNVKATIPGTGIFAEKAINAQTKGTITSIALTPALNEQIAFKAGAGGTISLAVTEIDAAGVRITGSPDDYILSSSDVTLVATAPGSFAVTNTSSVLKTGVATITAVNKVNGLSATVNIPVYGAVVGVTAAPVVADKDATVTLQLVDASGNKVSDNTIVNMSVYPGTLAVVQQGTFNASTGIATLKLRATEYGKYPVTVVTDNGIALTFDVTFGTPASAIPGADKINMYIGAKGFFADNEEVSCDVAPFIGEGDRTFVELRNLANAMGVSNEDITYVDGVITLVRADMTLVLTIGSQTIQKTVDGVTTTITSDVAPYVIAEAGRTVLPLRAVGEAFGYTVNYNPANQLITITK